MTTHPPQADDQTASSSGWDEIDVLQGRARAAAAQRDASIAGLRQVMDDQAILVEFGFDLSRLEG